MPATFDCIVIGAGGMGSGALYHLARRGVNVLGLERFGVAHDRGSSHGETRIIRKAYFEHPDYVPLLLRAYDLWQELQQEFRQPLLELCGLMLVGPPDGDTISGAQQAAELHRLPIENLTANAARQRFPDFTIPDEAAVVFEREAGYLHVERCVEAHLKLAERQGAVLHTHETVLEWQADGQSVSVRTDRQNYSAGSLVLCPGAWASRLLPAVPIQFEVLRKVLLWHPVAAGRHNPSAGGPIFFFESPQGNFYGLPSLDGRTVKLAQHSGGESVPDPTQPDRDLHPADIEPVSAFVRQFLPHVQPLPQKHAVCMYTFTPDGHFVVDRYPQAENVHFAAGFSGHGFKFASVMGELLADLALNGTTQHPIAFLKSDRFTVCEGEQSV